MSYARFGDSSDVYVFAHVGGFVQCCGCILGDVWDFHSAAEIVEHLREHEAAGHLVPDYLLDLTLYEGDFVAMCDVFMCRENAGHEGEHTPLHDARLRATRARLLTPIQVVHEGGSGA